MSERQVRIMSIELSLPQFSSYRSPVAAQVRQQPSNISEAANDAVGANIHVPDDHSAPATHSVLTLLLVLAAHALVFWLILTYGKIEAPQVQVNDAPPMLVSLVATPAPDPEPEMVEIIPEPKPAPKPIVKKVQPKPVVKEPEPLPQVSEPLPQVTEPTPVAATPAEAAPSSPVTDASAEDVEESTPPPAMVAAASGPTEKTPPPVVEEVVEPPRFGAAYLHNPPPSYPSTSRRLGEEGRVMLRVLVAKSGDADAVEIESSSGSSRLDKAAREAVKKWKFIPAKRNNQPINAYVLVPIQFTLNS